MRKAGDKTDKILKAMRSFIPRHIAASEEIAGYDYFESIVFCADISGFTAMSEKLTTTGKEGSEEISKIINSFFNPLIRIIDSYGGDIFFFGGDAITAVFSSDNDKRALKAAIDAIAFVKNTGRVKTSQGNFNISIHIALTKGNTFFRQTDKLFMLAGNTCFRVIKLLDLGRRQDIVIDSTMNNAIDIIRTRKIAPGAYRVSKNADIKVSKRKIKLPDTKNKLKKQEISRLYKFIPKWMERRVEINQTFDQKDGEHRKAAIAFLHFRNIPFDKDTKTASRICYQIGDKLDKISEKYGGWVNKIDFYKQGIRALMIFGFPSKLENDERHAVMFAKELLEIKELKDVDIRIGINSGLIFGTPVGSNIRREYTVMGDTVNTAARIAAKARKREITVGKRVFDKTEYLFEYRKTRAKSYKGKSLKLHNYVFKKERRGKAAKSHLGKWISESKKLVGHKDEIKQYRQALNAVKKSKGRIVAFTGEAGLGKSRIVSEMTVIAKKNKFNVYEGSCLSYGSAMSYYPWKEILSRFFKINPDDSMSVKKRKITAKTGKKMNTWVPLIGEVLGVDFPINDIVKNLDNKIKKQKFFDIVYDILVKESKKRPICIVVEDVHWIDSISMELLNYISRNIEHNKILMLLAYRPIHDRIEFMDKDYTSEFKMTELSDDETAELVGNLLNIKQLPDAVKKLVIQRSQGNPFYVEEIVKSLIEQGFIHYERRRWIFKGDIKSIKLPDSVEGVILTRIDGMDFIERDVIQIASVLGREFDGFLLRGIYDNNKQLEKSMNILSALDLIKKGDVEDRYIFKHILTCETAYNTLSFQRKRELHRTVAKYIERKFKKYADEHAGMLSHHYYLSRDYDKALVYSVKAGDKAKNVFANEEAIEYYNKTIKSYEMQVNKGTHRKIFIKALSKRAEVYSLIGSNEKAMCDARRVLKESRKDKDAAMLAQSYELMSFMYDKTSRYKMMKNNAEKALEIYKQIHNRSGQATCLGYIGDYFMFTGNTDKAMKHFKEAVKISKQIKDIRIEADSITNMGIIYADFLQNAKKAVGYHNETIKLARKLNDRHMEGAALNNIANTYHMEGDLDTAEKYFIRSLEIINDIGDMEGISAIYNNIGVINFSKGRIEKSIKYFKQSLSIRRRIGDVRGIGICLNNLGFLYEDMGKSEKALQYNLQALDVRRSINDKAGEASTLINISTHYMKTDKLREAEQCLRTALKLKTALKEHKGIEKCKNLLSQIKKQQAPPNPQPGP